MATSFVGSTIAAAGSGSSFTGIGVPGGVLEGDLMLMIACDDAANLTASCSGWTTLLAVQGAMIILVRIAGASEPGSYTFSFGGGGVARCAGIMVYRGPISATPDASGGSTSGVNGVSLTPTVIDDFEIHIAVSNNDPTGLTAASGFVARSAADYFSLVGVWIEDRLDYASTLATGVITPGGTATGGTKISAHVLFPTVVLTIPRYSAMNHQNPALL